MCLILFSLQDHPAYKLVVAANRDEFFNRRTEKAAYWPDYTDVLGGRDLEAGGTWMGINRRGKIAMITNYRDPQNIRPSAPSRGNLVSEYLTGNMSASMYLKSLESRSRDYNGFNLIAGDADELMYHSNYSPGVITIMPGLHGLSNHLLETPWPKVERGKVNLTSLLHQHEILPEQLFALLYDEHLAPVNKLPQTGIPTDRERALSAMFIKTPDYGTRCSTIVLIDKSNKVTYAERTFDLTSYEFKTRSFNFKIQ